MALVKSNPKSNKTPFLSIHQPPIYYQFFTPACTSLNLSVFQHPAGRPRPLADHVTHYPPLGHLNHFDFLAATLAVWALCAWVCAWKAAEKASQLT